MELPTTQLTKPAYAYITPPRRLLFFDIETAVDPHNIQFMPSPEAPGNLRDPEKIAAAIIEKKAEQIERAPLDPDYGRVLSIGYALNCDGPITVVTGEERDILCSFWDALASCSGRAVGYNIIGFDLPYLMRRSMMCGVQLGTFPPALAKYRVEPIMDLMGILYNWGPAKSLKLVAKLLGLEVLAPDVDGSMVAKMPANQLVLYQKSDVYLVQQLFNRMNGVYFNL